MSAFPETVAELQAAVLSGPSWRVEGMGTKRAWAPPSAVPVLGLSRLRGIVEFSPADQVVSVLAGTPVAELQEELAAAGQALPIPGPDRGAEAAGFPGTVGGLLACDLPHGLMAQHGGPRDWVLGAKFVRADGTLAKSGSKVVKSVAGFDVHRMAVGSWGRWLVFAEAALKTWPLRGLAVTEAVCTGAGPARYVARARPSQFARLLAETPEVVAQDPAAGTVWAMGQPPDFADWWAGPGGVRKPEPAHEAMRARLDAALDPGGRFR